MQQIKIQHEAIRVDIVKKTALKKSEKENFIRVDEGKKGMQYVKRELMKGEKLLQNCTRTVGRRRTKGKHLVCRSRITKEMRLPELSWKKASRATKLQSIASPR
jgi:hypothetical protein